MAPTDADIPTSSPASNGPGSLADVQARHAEARGAAGRKPLPPSGDAKRDARRERDRARYRAAQGLPAEGPTVNARGPEQLFQPETCGAIVRLPFDMAGAFLKSESWSLDKDEAALLAGPCAETLNQWFPETDPKWAALTALALAALTVTSKKYMMWREEKREQKTTGD